MDVVQGLPNSCIALGVAGLLPGGDIITVHQTVEGFTSISTKVAEEAIISFGFAENLSGWCDSFEYDDAAGLTLTI